MVRGIDIIGSNKSLQSHWIRRFVAAIIDGVIVAIVFLILCVLLLFRFLYGWVFWVLGAGLIFGVLWLLYFAVLEGLYGATVGKKLLKLKVLSASQQIGISKGFVRNISKIHWLFLLIDIILGLATDGDPRQRYLDRVANTLVARADIAEELPRIEVSLSKEEIISAFMKIPEITEKKAISLYNAGFRSFTDLAGASPEIILALPELTLKDLKNIKEAVKL
ncbi:MAG: RDD family protein [Candidatus Thermoplasmatota archaeon]|nr:RDD family protein [Candidatus Thermoplasmatota archaeon]